MSQKLSLLAGKKNHAEDQHKGTARDTKDHLSPLVSGD